MIGLNRKLTPGWRDRVSCTAGSLGKARRPMSNILALIVATDKGSSDPDQVWFSVSIDLDRPVGSVALRYGPRLPHGIGMTACGRTLGASASGYEDLALQMGEQIKQALSAIEPVEFADPVARRHGAAGYGRHHAGTI